MTVLTVILSILLALAFLGAGVAKVTGQQAMVEAAAHTGFSLQNYKVIGGLEILGAVGVLVGLGVHALGGLAALGLLITMIGAVVVHVRKGDQPKDFAPAAGLGVLSLVVTLLDFTR